MALKTLSTSGISNGSVILPGQVTQSVDAFTGTEGYAVTLSGSFIFSGATTGSGFFTNAISSSKIFVASNASTNNEYTLVFKNDTGALNNYYELAADGTNGPYYNPSLNVLGGLGGMTISGSVGKFTSITGSLSGSVAGTASYAVSASNAVSAATSDTSTSTLGNTSYYVPSGSVVAVAGILKMFAGAGKTSTIPPYQAVVTVSPVDLTGKILNQSLFVGLAVSQSAQVVTVLTSNNTSITFESAAPGGVDFTFIGTYI
jgi:hypothetical protein